jgi:hypothetical protein
MNPAAKARSAARKDAVASRPAKNWAAMIV